MYFIYIGKSLRQIQKDGLSKYLCSGSRVKGRLKTRGRITITSTTGVFKVRFNDLCLTKDRTMKDVKAYAKCDNAREDNKLRKEKQKC